jgi:hypothetical protein
MAERERLRELTGFWSRQLEYIHLLIQRDHGMKPGLRCIGKRFVLKVINQSEIESVKLVVISKWRVFKPQYG